MTEMDGDEDYVGQLKEVFDDCDTSGNGFINRQDLILLCEKLQVEDHSDALVDRLIGTSEHKRVGFDEFKDGFVAVLSQCADLLSTEDEVSVNSHYEEEAVSPKFVRDDGKKYGRRSRPENQGAETPLDFADLSDMEMDYSYSSPSATPVTGDNRKLHTTPIGQSLAVATSHNLPHADDSNVNTYGNDSIAEVYDGEGPVNHSVATPGADSRSGMEDLDFDETEVLREIWRKQGVGKDGYLTFDELGSICENMGMGDMSEKDLRELFDKLDADNDGRVSFEEFVSGLSQHGGQPLTPSQLNRPHSSQGRRQLKFGASTDNDRRTQTPSILSAITGSGYFSCIDTELTGYAEPEDIMEFWESFGVSHDDVINVLESLAFDVDTRISLQELSSALEQELLNHDHDSTVYQVAIYSCRQELRYIKGVLETNAVEKDKLLEDIESAKKRNEVLIKEADERQSNQVKQHESLLSSVESKYQELLKSLQTQLDTERELLTSNAQSEKNKLETEAERLKEEERKLKQELSFQQKEMSDIERDLHSHIDKNSVLKKENDRIKRELSSVTELHRKMDSSDDQMEEMETHRTHLNDEQNKFSELRILELEEDNKKLRDREDELLLELEEIKMSVGKKSARGEGQGSRRGSLLSDYTLTKAEDDSSDHSDVDTVNKLTSKKTETTQQEDALRLEILKLKDLHADEVSKLKKVHVTEKTDIQDSFRDEVSEIKQQHRKLVADFEKRIDEEKLAKSGTESEWRRKYETEKAQLKLAASADKMELMEKLQEEHKEQINTMRKQLSSQCDKEIREVEDRSKQEHKLMETRLQKKIENYEMIFERGTEALRGKLRDDFFQLVEEQAQNEIEVEKRHLEATFQTEREELFELLNKEKQSMEDQFNDRLYELEDQMEDIEENVRGECEDDFLEQIQVVQLAFNEEREEYEKQISGLKTEIKNLEKKMETSADKDDLRRLREERDQAMNERDDVQLEKNKMMLARNNLERELEKVKRLHKEEKSLLQNQIEDLRKLSALKYPTEADISKPLTSSPSPHIVTMSETSALIEEKRSLEESNHSMLDRLKEAEEQIFKLTAELQLARSQHFREIQDLRLSANKGVNSEAYADLQNKLDREEKRCRELEEALKVQSVEGRKLLLDSQDDNHKTLANVRFEMQEYKNRLIATRKSLSEVTERLKQQMLKSTKSDNLVKELYIENANLMEALYVTEKRQKDAERKQLKYQTKCETISGTFNKFVPAVIETVSQNL